MSLSEIEATQAFGAFLAKLSNALTAKDITSIDDLFLPQGYLREYVIRLLQTSIYSHRWGAVS